MISRVMIFGTENIGTSIAFSILNQKTKVDELILVDPNKKDAEGEAMDLNNALSVTPAFLKIRPGTYADAKSCDVIIIALDPEEKQKISTLEAAKRKQKILKPAIKEMSKAGFNGVFLVVSDPVDILSYFVWKYSGLSPDKVIGTGTILDSTRLRQKISERLLINPDSIHAYEIGAHGHLSFPLWSTATAGNEPITSMLREPTRKLIEKETKLEPHEIVRKKGIACYGISLCAVQILNTILGNERRIFSVSTYDDNNDVFYSFPSIIGRRGVYRHINTPLSEQEGVTLQKSINDLKNIIKFAK